MSAATLGFLIGAGIGFTAFVVMIGIVALMMYDLIRDIGED